MKRKITFVKNHNYYCFMYIGSRYSNTWYATTLDGKNIIYIQDGVDHEIKSSSCDLIKQTVYNWKF